MIGWPIDRSIFVRISSLCKHISKSLFYSSHPLPNCPSPTDYRRWTLWKIEIQTEKFTRDEWKSIKAMTRAGKDWRGKKNFQEQTRLLCLLMGPYSRRRVNSYAYTRTWWSEPVFLLMPIYCENKWIFWWHVTIHRFTFRLLIFDAPDSMCVCNWTAK